MDIPVDLPEHALFRFRLYPKKRFASSLKFLRRKWNTEQGALKKVDSVHLILYTWSPSIYICNSRLKRIVTTLMKDQLIEKLNSLLDAEDIMSVRDAVRDIRNDWKAETAKERQLQEEAFKLREDKEEGEVFVYSPHESEGRFQELLKKYEDRIEEHGKKLAAERLHNFKLKQIILSEFEVLRNEENIGKAFATHKELKERWDAIGDVPGDKYHEVQEKWHRMNQDFFYQIKIYKELQENDLKINLRKKEELIEEAGKLTEVEQISDLEILSRKLQREWMDVGPSPRDTFQQLGDTFFALLRDAQTRIQAHYDELHSHSEEALEKKRALVAKMKEVLSLDLVQHGTWNRYTDEVLKLQEEWKTTGWARKKENEEVWQEFRGLCDLFFSKRKEFVDQRKNIFREHREKKEALIEEAKKVQESSDWKDATEVFKKLQEQWKSIGSADPREEQKLWQRFRSACDVFFTRKKEHFGEISGQQEENLRLKNELLTEMDQFALSGNRPEDLRQLKEFSERWHAIGFVPKSNIKEVMDRYNAILDARYGQLNAKREEQELTAFRSRLQHMKSAGGGQVVSRERNFLRDKIERLRNDIRQYENNMGIFTGKGAETLRKEIEKKIKNAEREIDDLKKKLAVMDAQ